jgi:hypothetical protein
MQSLSDADFQAIVDRVKGDDSKYVDGDIRTLLAHCHALREAAKRLTAKMDFVSYPIPEHENAKLVNELDDVVRQTAVRIPA